MDMCKLYWHRISRSYLVIILFALNITSCEPEEDYPLPGPSAMVYEVFSLNDKTLDYHLETISDSIPSTAPLMFNMKFAVDSDSIMEEGWVKLHKVGWIQFTVNESGFYVTDKFDPELEGTLGGHVIGAFWVYEYVGEEALAGDFYHSSPDIDYAGPVTFEAKSK